MLTREALHRLVDDLPEDLIDRAGDSIRRLHDPVLWAIENAPLDDEPELRASERRLIDERLARFSREGQSITPPQLASIVERE